MAPTDPTKVNADSLDGGESIQTTLGVLWELLGKGTHEAWPDAIKYHGGTEYGYYLDHHGDRALITVKHALAIVRDHIEGWLVESTEGTWVKPLGMTKYILWIGSCDYDFDTLTDAVQYALNQSITHTKE